MKRCHEDSMKSSISDHVMDVTEVMFEMPEEHGFIF